MWLQQKTGEMDAVAPERMVLTYANGAWCSAAGAVIVLVDGSAIFAGPACGNLGVGHCWAVDREIVLNQELAILL